MAVDLETVVQHVIVMATPPYADPTGFNQYGRALTVVAQDASLAQRNQALERLSETIKTTDIYYAGLLSICCGALVEHGAEPALAIEPILEQLDLAIDLSQAFLEACRKRAADPDVPAQQLVAEQAAVVRKGMPHSVNAWAALNYLSLASISSLSVDADLRARVQQDATLSAKVHKFAKIYQQNLLFLSKLLHVLDEEIVVLHPQLARGFRVHIKGVGDNAQLQTLLVTFFLNEGLLPPPDNFGVEARTLFGMWPWRNLSEDRTLLADLQTMMALDGIPADIEPFAGQRVVLLGAAQLEWDWPAKRMFYLLEPSIELVDVLDKAAVSGWLTRLQTASDG